MNTLDAIEMMHEAHSAAQAVGSDAAWRFVTWVFWIAVAVMVLGAAVIR